MSLESILRNIYSFLDVLQTARSDKVKDWDEPMVDNAIRWARYSQQLYSQACGKSYQSELDQQIQNMGQLPWCLGDININLELLRQSEDLMKKVLLQNPCLSSKTFEYLLKIFDIGTESGQQEVIQVCHTLNMDKTTLDLANILSADLDKLTTGRNQDNNNKAFAIILHSKAELLMSFVAATVQKTPALKTERTNTFLKKKLTEFAMKPGALPVLGAALQDKYPDILKGKEQENMCKTVILQTILDLPAKHREDIKAYLV